MGLSLFVQLSSSLHLFALQLPGNLTQIILISSYVLPMNIQPLQIAPTYAAYYYTYRTVYSPSLLQRFFRAPSFLTNLVQQVFS